ncbi:MAG: sulfotransferase family protein [Saprospiraceae bacterium]|nr:sulfotransferase family protein [Saprospiraceae bacterium]
MALLLKNGAIFLHVPKTGGSWVTKVLEEQGLVKRRICHIHADLDRIYRYKYLGKILRSELSQVVKPYFSTSWKIALKKQYPTGTKLTSELPFIFCFVRNPIDWYLSFYRYMVLEGWPRLGDSRHPTDWHPCSDLNELPNETFDLFIDSLQQIYPGFLTSMYSKYTDPRISFVGKQETLVDDLITVLRHLNLTFDEDQIRTTRVVNQSNRILPAEIICNKFHRKTVYETEYAVFKKFGYRIDT